MKSEFAEKFDDGESCIRLYRENGKHILSILPYAYRGDILFCDLGTPDGKVLYCGIEEGLVETLAKYCEIESISPPKGSAI